MKLTKLLTGAAVAALMTGAASAQIDSSVTLDDAIAAGTMFSQKVVASEYDITALGNQQIEFFIEPDSDEEFATFDGTQADILITLTGGVFPTGVVEADNPAFGGCDANLQGGGLAGESTVTFRVADIGACDDEGTNAGFAAGLGDGEDVLGFRIPVDFNASTANISYSITAVSNGAAITSGSYEGTAVDPVLVAGTQALDSLLIGTSGFAVSVVGTDREAQLSTTGVSYNALDNAVIGTLTFSNETQTDLGTGADVTPGAGATAADWDAAGQVDEVEVIVSLDDPSGFASVTLDGPTTNDTTVALTSGSATFTITDTASAGLDTTELGAGAINVRLNADADDATLINETNFTIAVSTVDGATGSGLTIAGGSDTEQLTREGESSATFEWVGDATASTSNVFRFTGLSTTDSPAISFFVTNASSDDALNGEYALGTYTPTAGGELIVTGAQLAGIIGSDFGRADIRFFVEGSVDDIRRFHVTEGVITLGNDN